MQHYTSDSHLTSIRILGLTGKLQLKAFTRVLSVGDELEPHAAGSAVDAGAEHFGAAEGAQ